MQEIVNVRIDGRMIHGQVAIFWTGTLKATRIMVIDDGAAKDEIQKMALKMACPPGVKLSILPVEKAVANINAGKYEGERVFVVVRIPETLVKLWDAGFRPESVNVGNMGSGVGTKAIRRSVHVSPAQVEIFKDLHSRGMNFYAQMVPNDESVEFMGLL